MQFTRRNATILAIGAAVIVIGLIILFAGDATPAEDAEVDPGEEITVHEGLEGTQEVRNEEAGIAFTYQAGDGGYRLTEPPVVAYGEETMLHSYVLIEETAYQAMEAGTTGSEPPPTMTVFVFANPEEQTLLAWAEAHETFSNLNLAVTTPNMQTVAGADALSYRADGLYVSDVYVISHEGRIYVLTGGFIAEESPLRADFEALVESVELI